SPDLWNPEVHKDLTEYADFLDSGFQEIWLAENPTTLNFRWPSTNSLLLSFGLTSREWESIVSGDRGINDPSIDGRQRDFPLLSRLPNITAPIKYQPDEVSELREECLKAASLARDQITVK